MAPGQRPRDGVAATDPAIRANVGLLHRRHGWIWTMVVSLAGFVAAVAVAANAGTGDTASFVLDLVGLLMLIVFVAALAMVMVVTARLRKQAPEVRGPARAVHRTTRRRGLAHPHHRRRQPVVYTVGLLIVAGWIVGGVVFLPRLVDSAAYLAGAGGRATFVPGSYVQQCSRHACSIVTNGMLKIDGHPSAATWPAQVPLNVPFQVREPVWRWALGSGLINGTVTAIGSLLVGLLFEGGAVLVLFITLRPYLDRLRGRRRRPGGSGRSSRR